MPSEELTDRLVPVYAAVREASGIAFTFDREDRQPHANSYTFYLHYVGPLPAGNDVKVDATLHVEGRRRAWHSPRCREAETGISRKTFWGHRSSHPYQRGSAESTVVAPFGVSDVDAAGVRRSIPRRAANAPSGKPPIDRVAHLGIRLGGKIIGLVVEVLIRLRTNNVASAHRIPVLFRRSSNRRCLSSQ